MMGGLELVLLLLLVGLVCGWTAVPVIARKLGFNWQRYQQLRGLLGKVLFWRKLW